MCLFPRHFMAAHYYYCRAITALTHNSRHWSPGNSQIEILVPQRAFALSDILSPPSNTYVDLAPDYFKLYNLSAFIIQIVTFLRSSVYLPGTSPLPVNTDDLSLWFI